MKKLSKRRILADIVGGAVFAFLIEFGNYFLHPEKNAFHSPLRMCFLFILFPVFFEISDSVLSRFKKNKVKKESKTNEE